MNSLMRPDRHLRMHREKQRRLRQERNRRDVLRIVGQLGVELRIDRQDRAVGHHEGLAVGRRAHERVDRDAAVCAGAVLDHHVLTQPLLQPPADDTRDRIRQPARRMGDDELDGLGRRRRLSLRRPRCKRKDRERGNGRECGAQRVRHHEPSPKRLSQAAPALRSFSASGQARARSCDITACGSARSSGARDWRSAPG